MTRAEEIIKKYSDNTMILSKVEEERIAQLEANLKYPDIVSNLSNSSGVSEIKVLFPNKTVWRYRISSVPIYNSTMSTYKTSKEPKPGKMYWLDVLEDEIKNKTGAVVKGKVR
jgi:hypothetical protein